MPTFPPFHHSPNQPQFQIILLNLNINYLLILKSNIYSQIHYNPWSIQFRISMTLLQPLQSIKPLKSIKKRFKKSQQLAVLLKKLKDLYTKLFRSGNLLTAENGLFQKHNTSLVCWRLWESILV